MKKLFFLALLFSVSFQNINAQWVTSTYPQSFKYFDLVHFYNPNVAIGLSYFRIFITKDGGKSFSEKFNNISARNSLQAVSETSYYCIGIDKLKYADDSQTSWQTLEIVNGSNDTLLKGSITQFHFFNNGKGFVTSNETAKTTIYKTNNWGLTWFATDTNKINIQPVINQTTTNPSKMYEFDSTVIVRNIYSKNRLQFYTNYGDSAYEVDFSLLFNGNLIRYAFKDKLNGMFLCSNQEVYKTTDGCKTLIQVTKTPVYCGRLDYAKATGTKKAFYIAGSGLKGSFYTMDDGNSWQEIGDFYSYASLDFFDANTGVSSNGSSTDKIQYFTGLTGTGINKSTFENNSIKLYPNPCNNFISLNSDDEFSYTIFNINGILALEGKITNKNKINIESLGEGMYVINLNYKNTQTKLKFLKAQ